MTSNKTFPIMKSGGMKIPWSVAEQAYLRYAQKYGDSQTLETIAKRGGFDQTEMDILHPEWREHIRLKHQLAECNQQLINLMAREEEAGKRIKGYQTTIDFQQNRISELEAVLDEQ